MLRDEKGKSEERKRMELSADCSRRSEDAHQGKKKMES
jgi:hypothetical protein